MAMQPGNAKNNYRRPRYRKVHPTPGLTTLSNGPMLPKARGAVEIGGKELLHSRIGCRLIPWVLGDRCDMRNLGMAALVAPDICWWLGRLSSVSATTI